MTTYLLGLLLAQTLSFDLLVLDGLKPHLLNLLLAELLGLLVQPSLLHLLYIVRDWCCVDKYQ